MHIDHKPILRTLQQELKRRGVDIWLVFLSDDHMSEYVDDHYKEIEFLSGFTGSNATMVIMNEEALLWTDGRYFLQAEDQLADTGVRLMKMNEPGVPTVSEYVKKQLKSGMTLGFDGRRISAEAGEVYRKLAEEAGAKLHMEGNLVDLHWTSRPPKSAEPIWILEERFSGKPASEKIERVRAVMKQNGADAHLLTTLCDIAWLFNLRGSDIEYTPVFLSFALITQEDARIYLQKSSVSRHVLRYLKRLSVAVRPYRAIYEDVKALEAKAILYDPKSVNAVLASRIPESVKRMEQANPTAAMKARKNRTEIRNTRRAHMHDGIAVTKFIYWLKHLPEDVRVTELEAAEYLSALRSEQTGFLDESFETISAYGSHGAIVHYAADEESDIPIERRGLYLVDSGGHYLTGTTDITRTIAMGELTRDEIAGYTLVLKGALRLMAQRFPRGTTGAQLDVLARAALWNEGLEFKHGTGHGVGHILSVHEGPNSISKSGIEELRAGMITTDEPGVYIEGAYGVRIENELLCVREREHMSNVFYRFENITLAPIDLDPVDVSRLSEREKQTLNAYHARVYEMLHPHLEKNEAEWLKTATRSI